jgi:hypothetical protein
MLCASLQLGHDGVTPGSGWFVKEVEVDMPTRGKHYFFTCKSWLARDKGDGKTTRFFSLNEGESSVVSYKPSEFHLFLAFIANLFISVQWFRMK